MKLVKSFFNDLKQNKKALESLGNPRSQITLIQQEIDQVDYANKKTYYKYTVRDKDYGIFKIENKKIIWKKTLGTVSSAYKQGIINRPWHVRKFDDMIWVSNLYRPLAKFDSNFSFQGYFGEYGEFSNDTPNRYRYCKGFTIDSNTVYMAFQWRHRVGAYDKNTGEMKWIFGTGEVGLPADSKLSSPIDIAILPNGNILVACWDINFEGKGAGGIVELDKDTGSFVKTHLSYKRDGSPWNQDIHCPSSLKIIQNNKAEYELWISYYYKNCIGIFSYDKTTNSFTYKKIIGKTSKLDVGALYIQDFCVDSNYEKVYLLANGPKVAACVNISNNDLIAYVGKSSWEDYSTNPNTLGGFFNPSGIEIVDENSIFIADYSNNRIQQFDTSLFDNSTCIDVEYDGIAHDFEKTNIEYISNSKFDFTNKVLHIPVNQISSIKIDPEIIVCESCD